MADDFDDVDARAGRRLQAWRESIPGMTQAKLGELAGTTGSVISLLESGERKLSPKWLERLAPALGTTPGNLIDRDPGDPDPSAEVDAVIDIWAHIPEQRRQHAREILQTFRHQTGTDDA